MNRMYELRIERNMTQEQVADYLRISKKRYADIENEKSQLKVSQLLKLIQLYEVSSDYLLGLADVRKYQD